MDDPYTKSTHPKAHVCAPYFRISTAAQETKIQSDDVLAEVKRLKLKIYDTYEDVISGSQDTRIDLERLKRDAQHRRFGVVLIWRVDRLTRVLRHGLQMFEELETQFGLQVRFIKEPHLNTGAPGYRMARNFVLMGAEMELGAITQRNRAWKTAWLRAGKWATKWVPYGYSLQTDHTLTIMPKQAKIVRAMFKYYILKSFSSQKIADRLNDKNVPAPRTLHWKKSSVMKILSNPIYTGTHSAGKALGQISQTHPSIISKALFEKAQSMKKIKMTYSPKNLKREYLFRGMVACHKCGFNLFGRCKPMHGRDYISYDGFTVEPVTKRCNPRCGGVSEIKLTSAIALTVLNVVSKMDDESIDSMLRSADENQDAQASEILVSARENLARLGEREERVKELYMSGQIDRSRKNKELDKLRERQQFFTDKLAQCDQRRTTSQERLEFKKRFRTRLKTLRHYGAVSELSKLGETARIQGNDKWQQALKDYTRALINTGIVGKVYVDFAREQLLIHQAQPGTPNISAQLRTQDKYRVNAAGQGSQLRTRDLHPSEAGGTALVFRISLRQHQSRTSKVSASV